VLHLSADQVAEVFAYVLDDVGGADRADRKQLAVFDLLRQGFVGVKHQV